MQHNTQLAQSKGVLGREKHTSESDGVTQQAQAPGGAPPPQRNTRQQWQASPVSSLCATYTAPYPPLPILPIHRHARTLGGFRISQQWYSCGEGSEARQQSYSARNDTTA